MMQKKLQVKAKYGLQKSLENLINIKNENMTLEIIEKEKIKGKALIEKATYEKQAQEKKQEQNF